MAFFSSSFPLLLLPCHSKACILGLLQKSQLLAQQLPMWPFRLPVLATPECEEETGLNPSKMESFDNQSVGLKLKPCLLRGFLGGGAGRRKDVGVNFE